MGAPSGLVAVATDVGAWRVLLPVLRELARRGTSCRVMLAEPAASIACQDGVDHVPLTGPTLAERADTVLAARPTALLLGTSVQAVVEREVTRRVRQLDGSGQASAGPVPTLAVLDAMLFVERRFGVDLAELPGLVACPDEETVRRLRQAGAPDAALIATGNPTLEEIWLTDGGPPPPALPPRQRERGSQPTSAWSSPLPRKGVTRVPGVGGRISPVDILFVSSPVAAMRLRGAVFSIDEREALQDVLAALSALRTVAPGGFRVRVRRHPVQRPDRLPTPPPGVTLDADDDPDRLASCARARVVVGLSSTLLGEARFLPRAAVAYLPGPFWEQERVFAPEYGVQVARSRDHLRRLLAEALREQPAPAPLDGHLGAAGRVADLLAALTPPAP
jgi:hypothetical protein